MHVRPAPRDVVDNESAPLARSWFAVALAHHIHDQPHPVSILGTRWVVLRLDGELVAFADRCPHRLAPLSIGSVTDSRLRCGYHGWEFDSAGACTFMPALGADAALPPRAQLDRPAGVAEAYGLVWIAPEPPVCDLPTFAEWDDPAFDRAWNEPRRTSAGAVQLCDNFLDAAHIPVVHAATFGVPGSDKLPPDRVERDGFTASTTYRVTYRNHDDPLVATGEHPLEQPQDLYKELRAATTAIVRLDFPLTGKTVSFLFSCLPEEAGRTTIFKMMARNDLGGDQALLDQALAFEETVLDEDLAVLEAYPTQATPIDTTAEVHTRVDRLSTTYRRILRELVDGDAS